MPTSSQNESTDFPFIAHSGVPDRSRRQIPTFVRAHVMNRYHSERRAKKGIKQNENPVWSQYEFLEPGGSGNVSKAQDETPIQQRGTRNKEETVKPPRPLPGSITCPQNDAEQEKKPPEKTETGTELAIRRVNRRSQRLPSSLMPYDSMEMGGPRLISILESYYGAVDRKEDTGDSWHKFWAPFAFSDPVLFHASLSKFPLHLAATVGTQEVNAECLKHKGIAIQKISERLRDPTQQPTDQLIAAVICLLGSELISRDVGALKAHLYGVRQMVAMRGGVSCLGDGVLPSGYLSYEFVIAALAREIEDDEGLSPAKLWGIPDPHQLSFPSQYGIFTLDRELVDPTSYGFSHEIVLFLRALCLHLCVSDVFVNTGDAKCSKTLEVLIKEFESKETEVLVPEDDSTGVELDTRTIVREDHVLQSLIQAAIIQLPQLSKSPVPTTAERVKKLHYHLSCTNIYRYWKPIPGALLWCFMVGTTASKDCPERAWFVSQTIRSACGIAYENLEGLRIALETFQRLARQQERDAGYLSKTVMR